VWIHHPFEPHQAGSTCRIAKMKPNSGDRSLTIFRTSDAVPPGSVRELNWLPHLQSKTPAFLVPRESALSGFWRSLRVLFTRVRSSPSRSRVSLFRTTTVTRLRVPGRPLAASLALHCSFIIMVFYLHSLSPNSTNVLPESFRREIIYYRVPLRDSPKLLPHIAPAGQGARPGSGSMPDRSPVLGSTASRWNLTVVSRPLHPDNFRQTIFQPSSPPDLRITTEVKVPNIVLGKPSELPKAPLSSSDARPKEVNRQRTAEAAPSPSPTNTAASLMTFLEPSVPQPHLVLPSASGAAPTRNSGNAVPSGGADPGDTTALLAIGVDPSAPSLELGIPPGNRWGEFSIAPGGGLPGSPGGTIIGAAGGTAGSGPGGDPSTGVSIGLEGGGGASVSSLERLSISETGKSAEPSGSLGPGYAASLVYPVPVAVLPRRNSLVVSAGPIGGGGLEVYRALHCGKIYTVFLAMPGKNWTLQYCEQSKPAADAPDANGNSTVIHLQPGIVPPDAESRFDFRRLSVPPDKMGKMIVLKGTLLEDGTVNGLQIYQGVLPEMDEAARIAFGRWKFKPAMREGKPLVLQILVGIPPVPNVAP
jgi:hypothetical protein